MNWTEGSLARHARRRSIETKHQKQHSARACTIGGHHFQPNHRTPPPEAFSFIGKTSTCFLPIPRRAAADDDVVANEEHSTTSSKRLVMTNSAPGSSFWPRKENKKRKKHDRSEQQESRDEKMGIYERKRRLLLNLDWVGANRAKAADRHSRHGISLHKKMTSKHISPFFLDAETDQRTRSPLLHGLPPHTNIEPKVYIGNQSLRGTSEYHVTSVYRGTSEYSKKSSRQSRPRPRSQSQSQSHVSYCSRTHSDNWPLTSSPVSPKRRRHSSRLLPATPIKELAHLRHTESKPKYVVDSSPASFHQPLPQRNLQKYEASRKTSVKEFSIVASGGKSSSSSGLELDSAVIEEWRAFLGLSVSPKAPTETSTQLLDDGIIVGSVGSGMFLSSGGHDADSEPNLAIVDKEISPIIVQSSTPIPQSVESSIPNPSSPPHVTGLPDRPLLDLLEKPANKLSLQNNSEISHSSGSLCPDTANIPNQEVTTQLTTTRSPQVVNTPLLTRTAIMSDQPAIELHSSVQRVASPKLLPILTTPSENSARPESRMQCSEDDWMKFVFGEEEGSDTGEDTVMAEALQETSRVLVPSDPVASDVAEGGFNHGSGSGDEHWVNSNPSHFQDVTAISDNSWTTGITFDTTCVAQGSSSPTTQTTTNTSAVAAGTMAPSDTRSSDIPVDNVQGLSTWPNPATTEDSHNSPDSSEKPPRFSLPKLFVGRLASGSGAVLDSTGSRDNQIQVHERKTAGRKKKRKKMQQTQKWKSLDGRPNIRSLPDFEDDPVEDSCEGED